MADNSAFTSTPGKNKVHRGYNFVKMAWEKRKWKGIIPCFMILQNLSTLCCPGTLLSTLLKYSKKLLNDKYW